MNIYVHIYIFIHLYRNRYICIYTYIEIHPALHSNTHAGKMQRHTVEGDARMIESYHTQHIIINMNMHTHTHTQTLQHNATHCNTLQHTMQKTDEQPQPPSAESVRAAHTEEGGGRGSHATLQQWRHEWTLGDQ